MPKVTGLDKTEIQKLNDTLESLLHKGMDAAEPLVVNSKAERTVFKLVQMAVKMAEHLGPERKVGDLVAASNKLLPKLSKYFNNQVLFGFLPPELKTNEMADLCDKAGAKPLAQLLRDSVKAASAPITAPAPAVDPATPVASATPVVPAANLQVAPTPVIAAGPGAK